MQSCFSRQLSGTRCTPSTPCIVRARGGGQFGRDGLQGLDLSGAGMNFGGQQGSRGRGDMSNMPNLAKLAQGLNMPNQMELAPEGNFNPEAESAINYDPEGLFKGVTTMQDGHITRRTMMKSMEDGEDAEKVLEAQMKIEMEKAQRRREATALPSASTELVEFFLSVETDDLEYFVAKCRPLLTADFFADLDGRIGQLRFLEEADQDGLDELIGLREYVKEFVAAQASVNQGVTAATENLKKLLMAKDKKQMILDMAAANEIDVALLALLQENIAGAEAAGQAQAAEFMTKVKNACAKYMIKPEKLSEAAAVRKAIENQKKNAPAVPKLILPN